MIKRIPGQPGKERQQVVPMARPVYTFDNQPNTESLRAMAVQCMLDQLSIMWRAPKDYIFTTRPGRWVATSRDKTTSYLAGKIYHGLPYVRAGTALPQFYEYYNTTTGELEFPGDGKQLWLTLGHSCASCVVYSWYSVCNSLGGRFAQRMMVPGNGVLPVAPCKIPEDIDTFLDYSTQQVIDDNGKDVIFEAYANVKPADALNTQPKNHVMMATANAHVVRDADGKIDPVRSFIIIQDQRSGMQKHESGFYEYLDDGFIERYTGRFGFEMSFQRLLDEGYIPLTTAEFMGLKPYEKATSTFVGNTDSIEGVIAGHIESNYPACVVRVTLFDHETREELRYKKLLKTDDISDGLGNKYPLCLHEDVLKAWSEKEAFTLTVDAVLTTNETFRVIDTVLGKGE